MKSKIGIIVIFLAILLLEFAPATNANATTIGTSKTYTNLSDYTTYYILGNTADEVFAFGAGSQLAQACMYAGHPGNTIDQYYVVAFEVSTQTQYSITANIQINNLLTYWASSSDIYTGIYMTVSLIQFGYIHGTTLASITSKINQQNYGGGTGLATFYKSLTLELSNNQLYPGTSYEAVVDFHFVTYSSAAAIEMCSNNQANFGITSLSISQ